MEVKGMSDSDFLSQAFNTISGRSAAIDEKIQRLEQAKGDVQAEQSESMNEITRIKDPALADMWKGSHAETYDTSREDAYETMHKITEDYDRYVTTIEWEIRALQAQRAALDFAGSIARAADELLDKGEEMVEAAAAKINQLKGLL